MAMTLVMVGSSFDFLHGLHLCYKLRRFWPPWNRLNRLWLPSPIFSIVSPVFFESKQKGHASWHSLCNDEIAGFPWVFRQSRRFSFIHRSRDRIRHRTSMMAVRMVCHRAISGLIAKISPSQGVMGFVSEQLFCLSCKVKGDVRDFTILPVPSL